MGGLALMCKFISFFLLWTALFVGTNSNIYLAKKMGIANWPIKAKKKIFYIIVFIVKKMSWIKQWKQLCLRTFHLFQIATHKIVHII